MACRPAASALTRARSAAAPARTLRRTAARRPTPLAHDPTDVTSPNARLGTKPVSRGMTTNTIPSATSTLSSPRTRRSRGVARPAVKQAAPTRSTQAAGSPTCGPPSGAKDQIVATAGATASGRTRSIARIAAADRYTASTSKVGR
jgi:hypothetical protein